MASLFGIALGLVSLARAGADWQALDWSHSRQVERALRSGRVVLELQYVAAGTEAESRTVRLNFEALRELGRMLAGEVSPRTSRQLRRMTESERRAYFSAVWDHSAWVLWTVVNRAYSSGDLVGELRRFSQPLNPDWRRDGRFCDPASPDYRGRRPRRPCADTRLRRRDRISSLEWSEMDPLVRALVLSFAAGHMPSPDGRVIDFAVPYRGICVRNSQDVIHTVDDYGWNHAFCGVRDSAGLSVTVSPRAWAEHFPRISEALDPFHAGTEEGTDPEAAMPDVDPAPTDQGTDPEPEGVEIARLRPGVAPLAPEVAGDGDLEGLPVATPDPVGLDLESNL